MGRPKGSKTKKPVHMIRAIIDEISMKRTDPQTKREGLTKVIEAMFELAEGARVERANPDGGVIVYREKPDVAAAKFLAENRFGKPKETVEMQTPDLAPNSQPFLIIPQLPVKEK